MKVCHKCGAEWLGATIQPGVKEVCEKCAAYLHCCLNCRHHDRSRPNQCRVPNTETIGDRSRANFCDEFSFREGASAKDVTPDKGRQAFEALFAGEEETEVRKPKSFEDLFGG